MSLAASLLVMVEVSAAVSGPVRHYVRTNSDGSEGERVVVYAPSPGEVEVFKGRNRCTDAAYVTGRLDPESGQAIELIGGRLTPELTQRQMAWLSRNADGVLALRFKRGDSVSAFSVPAADRWVQFDFDFSELIAHPPAEILARKDLQFDLPLLLTGDAPSFLNLGEFRLTLAGEMPHHGRSTIFYLAGGPALNGGKGRLWFDSSDGRLVEARLPMPNHAEYTDFKYTLVREEEGEAAWREVLADHWRDCPPDED